MAFPRLSGYVNCPADAARGNPGAAIDLSWLSPGGNPACAGPTTAAVVTYTDPSMPRSSMAVGPTAASAPRSALSPAASSASAPRSAVTRSITNAAARARSAFSPYGTFEDLKGAVKRGFSGLGIILWPFGNRVSPGTEIQMMRQSYGRGYCGPFDAQFNTRGEMGNYYDGLAGGLAGPKAELRGPGFPTDLEMSRLLGYTPYMTGWVPFKEVTWSSPWYPPDGRGANGYTVIGPPLRGAGRGFLSRLRAKLGLGEDDGTETVPKSVDERTADSALVLLKKHQDRTFTLSVLSTIAIASTSALAFWQHYLKRRKERKSDSSSSSQSPNPVLGGRRRRRRR